MEVLSYLMTTLLLHMVFAGEQAILKSLSQVTPTKGLFSQIQYLVKLFNLREHLQPLIYCLKR